MQFVHGVAYGVSAGNVGPSPVRVEHNGTLLVSAALATSASAGLPSHLGMGLRLGCANLLSAGGPEEGERSDGECPVHSDCRVKVWCWMSKRFDCWQNFLYRNL
jgi:hypothetical protein